MIQETDLAFEIEQAGGSRTTTLFYGLANEVTVTSTYYDFFASDGRRGVIGSMARITYEQKFSKEEVEWFDLLYARPAFSWPKRRLPLEKWQGPYVKWLLATLLSRGLLGETVAT